MKRLGSFSLVLVFCFAASVSAQDADGDGVPDAEDNCPDTPNPGQELTGDGRPAACTANPGINVTDLTLDMVELSLDKATGTFGLKNDTGESRGVTIESIEVTWESIGREGARTEGTVVDSMFQAMDAEGNVTMLEAGTIIPAGAEWTVNYMVSIDPPAPEGTREIKNRVLIHLEGRDHLFQGSGSHMIPHEDDGEEEEEEEGGDEEEGGELLPALRPTAEPFLRGDFSSDGLVDITDPIRILGNIFENGAVDVTCWDTGDANDDGSIDISDGVYLLLHLFAGGAQPSAPYPALELDPTPDFLWCWR